MVEVRSCMERPFDTVLTSLKGSSIFIVMVLVMLLMDVMCLMEVFIN